MMTCSARIPDTTGNGSADSIRHGARSVRRCLFERRSTEEGMDPVQNRSERGFAQAPHPSSRSLKKNGRRRAISTAKTCTESDPGPRRSGMYCRAGNGTSQPPRRSRIAKPRSLRPAVGADKNGTGQSVCLPVGRLMSSSTNCEVTVSDVVSMIGIVPPHDSCTRVSTPGRPGCHMEASERRSRSRSV